MSHLYVACELGIESSRVMLGNLHQDELRVGEVRTFPTGVIRAKDSLQWDIPGLYQQIIQALRGLGAQDEVVEGISCASWPGDYLLFGADGSLHTPAYHHEDPRTETGIKKVLAKVPWETIYQETGVHQMPSNTLFQLGAEHSRRLKHAGSLLPVADAFNYLLSGVPRVEMSMASTTQLYNPLTQSWSERLLNALQLPPKLFPPVVPSGTVLGALRPEVAREAGQPEARVIASCSHEIAAALAGLPIVNGEGLIYFLPGAWSLMGTQVSEPFINETGREMNLTHALGYGGSVLLSKRTIGFWLFEECRRYWLESDRELDDEVLTHLAIAAPPFEALINPADPRFLAPGDMPLKIQAFCKETNQPVPRKPGPVIRCVLESLALLYRRTRLELEYLTGHEITRLFVLGGEGNSLLNHFMANALQVPVTVAPAEAAAIGNVVVQALALGHIPSLEHARDLVQRTFKMQTIFPHSAAWAAAYDRFNALTPA